MPATTTTEAHDAIWNAVHANPDSTTSEIALLAGVGKTVTGKILAALEEQGHLTRQRPATGRPVYRWATAPGATTPGATAHSAAAPAAEPVPVPATDGKLAPGQLHQLVLAHLRAHPSDDMSPTQIHKALNRSSGAISNALERMVTTGLVTRTQDKPKRYRSSQ